MEYLTSEEMERVADCDAEKARLKLELHNVCIIRKNILMRGRQRKMRAK